MAGLLGEIFGAADVAKRRLRDFAANPLLSAQQALGNLNDRARNLNEMTAAAAQEGVDYGPASRRLGGLLADAYNPMGIVSPAVASSLKTVRNLPPDELFQQAVAGTPGARITDQGLAMRVQRGQMPNQSLMPSVRGGVFYLPEGAAQAKHYGTGKTGYGGPEKISGETVIANPLFVKGATGGKAPEAAYDSLFGKGAYQAMRSEALKSYGGYGARPSDKLAAVDNFLSKYAPELQDQAEYIVKNSQQGNQLAYALQEAAVGSAVRSAGHDAVLGYSKGKQGPFISEVFDVREMNYPDKFGTPTSLWEEFFSRP